tara:strand:+ start:622 stop:1101 length:480 start_codon:yes stop_codon:yes gene_type:complete
MDRGLSVLFVLAISLCAFPLSAKDQYAGYYYPNPVTKEAYRSRIRTLSEASREARMAFVTSITNNIIRKNSYPPQFTVYLKGSRQQKLIIVGLRDGSYNTIFRARALMAQLKTGVSTKRVMREKVKTNHLTFLDLLKSMGFEQLTISDGKVFSHQIIIR